MTDEEINKKVMSEFSGGWVFRQTPVGMYYYMLEYLKSGDSNHFSNKMEYLIGMTVYLMVKKLKEGSKDESI